MNSRLLKGIVIAVTVISIVLFGFGILMIREAAYFHGKGAHYKDMATSEESSARERDNWQTALMSAQGFATMDAAIAAAAFSFAGLVVAWTSLAITLSQRTSPT